MRGASEHASRVDMSVVIPAFDEADNLSPVVEELISVLRELHGTYEVVVVDDGSTDGTTEALEELTQHERVRSLRLRRNMGKSAALDAGLAVARGLVVVLMDADGQDDPHALPVMLDALENDLDLVTGRRAMRNDRFIKRTTSRLYNWVTARVTGIEGRDFNSGFKAMRHTVAESLELYGELHRYIPVLAQWLGFRVGEVDVPHRVRLSGESKFGGNRFWRGFLDLVGVKFLTTYTMRPLHLFGGLGFLTGLLGFAILVWLLVEQIFFSQRIGDRPALIAGVLLVIVGVQIVSLGLLATLVVHFSRRPRRREWEEPDVIED